MKIKALITLLAILSSSYSYAGLDITLTGALVEKTSIDIYEGVLGTGINRSYRFQTEDKDGHVIKLTCGNSRVNPEHTVLIVDRTRQNGFVKNCKQRLLEIEERVKQSQGETGTLNIEIYHDDLKRSFFEIDFAI